MVYIFTLSTICVRALVKLFWSCSWV